MSIKRLSDIDVTNVVYFKLSNPHYKDTQIMDFAFEYPKDNSNILGMFKLASRLDLHIEYTYHNADLGKWLDELKETYMGD